MRLTALVVTFVVCVACDYRPPPTAPTAPVVAAPAPAIALEVLPSSHVDFATGIAQIAVRARAADGALTHADVTCASTSGRLLPARFDAFFRGTELAQTTVPTRVTCSVGVLEDSTDVDMSAWSIDVDEHQWVPWGPGAGESRVALAPRQRIARVPATRVTLDWGDGTVEPWPFVPITSSGTRFHRYARAGLYTVTARIEWAAGVFERQFTLPGGPPVR